MDAQKTPAVVGDWVQYLVIGVAPVAALVTATKDGHVCRLELHPPGGPVEHVDAVEHAEAGPKLPRRPMPSWLTRFRPTPKNDAILIKNIAKEYKADKIAAPVVAAPVVAGTWRHRR